MPSASCVLNDCDAAMTHPPWSSAHLLDDTVRTTSRKLSVLTKYIFLKVFQPAQPAFFEAAPSVVSRIDPSSSLLTCGKTFFPTNESDSVSSMTVCVKEA